MEWLDKILSIEKLSFKTILAIAIVLGVVLLMPVDILPQCIVEWIIQFRDENGKYAFFIFLCFVMYIVLSLIYSLWQCLREKFRTKKI